MRGPRLGLSAAPSGAAPYGLWLRLSVVGLALKLQIPIPQQKDFLRCASAEPRAYSLLRFPAARNFHKSCGFYYLLLYYLCFNYLYSEPV